MPDATTPSGENGKSARPSLHISFCSFLISLGRAAMEHIGDPEKPGPPREPELAQQTIELIAILQEKTQGNLDDEESRLIESLLYELRTRMDQKAGLSEG
ncbi:MAG: DUF1844 domain-containing protein [Alphaproteobacteria bacterium]|nr:DUF1844 domain-containing protein [Alphaproteobacteria bacterium]